MRGAIEIEEFFKGGKKSRESVKKSLRRAFSYGYRIGHVLNSNLDDSIKEIAKEMVAKDMLDFYPRYEQLKRVIRICSPYPTIAWKKLIRKELKNWYPEDLSKCIEDEDVDMWIREIAANRILFKEKELKLSIGFYTPIFERFPLLRKKAWKRLLERGLRSEELIKIIDLRILSISEEAQRLLEDRRKKGLQGIIVGKGKARGKARFIAGIKNLEKVKEGEIVLCEQLTPELVAPLLLSKIAGVVAEIPGKLAHAVLILREVEIPCVGDIYPLKRLIKEGELIEIDATGRFGEEKGIVRVL